MTWIIFLLIYLFYLLFFFSPKHKQENHLCDVIKTFTVAFHCKLLNSFPGCKQGHILQSPWMSTEKKLEQSLGKPALRNVDTFHSWWLVLLNAPFSFFHILEVNMSLWEWCKPYRAEKRGSALVTEGSVELFTPILLNTHRWKKRSGGDNTHLKDVL